MAKYTEAFCVTTGSMISIMQMRSEYNHDPSIYEKVYKGHLFCPGCQAVPLTVVHTNGQLYYRGHPHEEHADGCWYALDERVVKSVTEINGDSEEQALSQLDSLLRATFNGNQQAANARATNRSANRSNAPVVHQQQAARRRLPQCRIEDLPVRLATNDRPQEISIYYGKVLCEIVNAKSSYNKTDIKVLVIKDAATKKIIMGLTISLAVWGHLTTGVQALLQSTQQPIHIAFLGGPSALQIQGMKLPHTCYLRKSTYLQVLED